MSRTGILSAVVAVIVALLWWLALPRAAQQAPPNAAVPNVPPPAADPSSVEGTRELVPATEPDKPTSPQPAAAADPSPVAELEAPTGDAVIPAPQLDGPVLERKRRYESEPRDSGAARYDALIQEAFRADVPPQLLKAVLCRQSICKLELRWSSGRNTGYMLGLTRLLSHFDNVLAVAPVGAANAEGVLPLEVYLQRLQASAPAKQ